MLSGYGTKYIVQPLLERIVFIYISYIYNEDDICIIIKNIGIYMFLSYKQVVMPL